MLDDFFERVSTRNHRSSSGAAKIMTTKQPDPPPICRSARLAGRSLGQGSGDLASVGARRPSVT